MIPTKQTILHQYEICADTIGYAVNSYNELFIDCVCD